MIEALAAVSCKATFPLMGGAWAVTVLDEQWVVAAVATPLVVAFGLLARNYPGRLRGKRGGAEP